jgi:hypothetical protein
MDVVISPGISAIACALDANRAIRLESENLP